MQNLKEIYYSSNLNPIPNPDLLFLSAAADSQADSAVPDSPEEGMKSLNALMTDMLAEAEKGGTDEKKVEARLLSQLRDMRAYREALAAKKQGPNSTDQFGIRHFKDINTFDKSHAYN